MTAAKQTLLVTIVARGAAEARCLWHHQVAVIEGRIGTLEHAVDNDIPVRRVVAQIVNDVAVIQSEIAEVRQALQHAEY